MSLNHQTKKRSIPKNYTHITIEVQIVISQMRKELIHMVIE